MYLLVRICDSRDLQYTLNAYTEVFKVKTVGSTKPPCFPVQYSSSANIKNYLLTKAYIDRCSREQP